MEFLLSLQTNKYTRARIDCPSISELTIFTVYISGCSGTGLLGKNGNLSLVPRIHQKSECANKQKDKPGSGGAHP